MKTIYFPSIYLLALIAVNAAEFRTAQKKIDFPLDREDRLWFSLKPMESGTLSMVSFIVAGDTEKPPKETYTYAILFKKQSVIKWGATWEQDMRNMDPEIKIKSEFSSDRKALTIYYLSEKIDEGGIKRMMEGPDGIYDICYSFKPRARNEKYLELWNGIISAAKLVDK